jgi:hypothetical protein
MVTRLQPLHLLLELEPELSGGCGVEADDLGLDLGAPALSLVTVWQPLVEVGPDTLAIKLNRVRLPRPSLRRAHDRDHLFEAVAHMARIGDIGLSRGESFPE